MSLARNARALTNREKACCLRSAADLLTLAPDMYHAEYLRPDAVLSEKVQKRRPARPVKLEALAGR